MIVFWDVVGNTAKQTAAAIVITSIGASAIVGKGPVEFDHQGRAYLALDLPTLQQQYEARSGSGEPPWTKAQFDVSSTMGTIVAVM